MNLELQPTRQANSRTEEPEGHARGDRARVVYETLHREILTLELRPSSLLDETQLARRFGMSRSPIREALNRLAAQNLVVMLPNRSTLVAPLNLSDIPRYIEALDLLQRINTRLAAQHRTDADIVEMTRRADLFDASVKPFNQLEMSATNKDFHMAVARAGRNPYLARHYEALLDEGRRMLHMHFDYLVQIGKEGVQAGEHHAMIAAIEARDVDEADRLAHAHTRQFHERFLKFLTTDYSADFRFDAPDGEDDA